MIKLNTPFVLSQEQAAGIAAMLARDGISPREASAEQIVQAASDAAITLSADQVRPVIAGVRRALVAPDRMTGLMNNVRWFGFEERAFRMSLGAMLRRADSFVLPLLVSSAYNEGIKLPDHLIEAALAVSGLSQKEPDMWDEDFLVGSVPVAMSRPIVAIAARQGEKLIRIEGGVRRRPEPQSDEKIAASDRRVYEGMRSIGSSISLDEVAAFGAQSRAREQAAPLVRHRVSLRRGHGNGRLAHSSAAMSSLRLRVRS